MKKISLCAVIASALLAGNVMADEAKLNPWQHCGIGAAVFQDNGAAAAISNIIWDLGTTAVSSNVSSQDSCQGKPVLAAMFIQDNFNSVIEETSQGSGAHLTAMLDILDVEASTRSDVLNGIRLHVAANVTSNTVTPEAYYNAVMQSI